MGSFVVRRARLVLVVAVLAVVGFCVLGFGAFGKLRRLQLRIGLTEAG